MRETVWLRLYTVRRQQQTPSSDIRRLIVPAVKGGPEQTTCTAPEIVLARPFSNGQRKPREKASRDCLKIGVDMPLQHPVQRDGAPE